MLAYATLRCILTDSVIFACAKITKRASPPSLLIIKVDPGIETAV